MKLTLHQTVGAVLDQIRKFVVGKPVLEFGRQFLIKRARIRAIKLLRGDLVNASFG
ncbi:MAG: hypothetical protein AB7G93_13690 [Bdellovibrionales bacterium]